MGVKNMLPRVDSWICYLLLVMVGLQLTKEVLKFVLHVIFVIMLDVMLLLNEFYSMDYLWCIVLLFNLQVLILLILHGSNELIIVLILVQHNVPLEELQELVQLNVLIYPLKSTKL